MYAAAICLSYCLKIRDLGTGGNPYRVGRYRRQTLVSCFLRELKTGILVSILRTPARELLSLVYRPAIFVCVCVCI